MSTKLNPADHLTRGIKLVALECLLKKFRGVLWFLENPGSITLLTV